MASASLLGERTEAVTGRQMLPAGPRGMKKDPFGTAKLDHFFDLSGFTVLAWEK